MNPNKYGGFADCNVDKRMYALWFQMLRRCYDTGQQKRRRGRTYAGCSVCPGWHYLSVFAEDIKIPIFMKESLRGLMGDDFRQEFPWEV